MDNQPVPTCADNVGRTRGYALVPVEVAATILDVSPTTIWRLAAAGKLTRGRMLGRTVFRREEVEGLAGVRRGEGVSQ